MRMGCWTHGVQMSPDQVEATNEVQIVLSIAERSPRIRVNNVYGKLHRDGRPCPDWEVQ
jgi:hypothetical protein